MAFEQKEWTDRQVQYPGRRKLIQTNIENVYDVERSEGTISEPGNAFDAKNMNDLEERIKAGFESIKDVDISVVDKNGHFVAERLDGVLDELFMFASNGKKAFANAIGGNASSTFQALADLAKSIKTDRDNGKKLIANAVGGNASSTFQVLADLAKSIKTDRDTGKQLIANAIGGSTSNTFQELANLITKNKNNYYEGLVPSFALSGSNSSPNDTKTISVSFGFTPKIVLLTNLKYNYDYYIGSTSAGVNLQISLSNITNQVTHNGFLCVIKNLTNKSITLLATSSTAYDYARIYLAPNAKIDDTSASKIYAFG